MNVYAAQKRHTVRKRDVNCELKRLLVVFLFASHFIGKNLLLI